MQADFFKKLEKAISGQAKEYASLNFSKNPFLSTTELEETQSLFVPRSELDDFARSFGDMMNGQLPVITIAGAKGIGKTHFLLFLYTQLKKISEKRDIGDIRLIKNKSDFFTFRNEYLGSVQEKKNYILFIDEAENIWNDPQSQNDLLTLITVPQIKIIWSWNIYSWKSGKQDTSTLPKTKVILLGKMTTELLYKILEQRIKYFSINKDELSYDPDAIRLITRISNGVPYSAIVHAERLLVIVLKRNVKRIGIDFVSDYIRLNRLPVDEAHSPELFEKLDKLTKTDKKILTIVYEYSTSYNRNGITATKTAELLGVTTPSAFFYLNKLTTEKGILEKIKPAKEAFYHIKGEYLAWIERIIQSPQQLESEPFYNNKI